MPDEVDALCDGDHSACGDDANLRCVGSRASSLLPTSCQPAGDADFCGTLVGSRGNGTNGDQFMGQCDEHEGHCDSDNECIGSLECRAGVFSVVSPYFVASGQLLFATDVKACAVTDAECDRTGVCGRAAQENRVCAPMRDGRPLVRRTLSAAAAAAGFAEGRLPALKAGLTYCLDPAHEDFCFNDAAQLCGDGERCRWRRGRRRGAQRAATDRACRA